VPWQSQFGYLETLVFLKKNLISQIAQSLELPKFQAMLGGSFYCSVLESLRSLTDNLFYRGADMTRLVISVGHKFVNL